MKSIILMFITAGLCASALSILAFYCQVPLGWRYLAYAVMGAVVGRAWRLIEKRKEK